MDLTERISPPDLLGDYWDELVREGAPAPPPRLDPDLIERLHLLVQRDDARPPSASFITSLEDRLLADAYFIASPHPAMRPAGDRRVIQPVPAAFGSRPAPARHRQFSDDSAEVHPPSIPCRLWPRSTRSMYPSGPNRSRAAAAALGMAALLLITLGAVAAIALLHQPPNTRGTGPDTVPALVADPVQFLWESRGLPTLSTTRGGLDVVFTMTDPYHVAIDSSGNIWVPDTWNNQLRILAPDGSLLETWGQKGAGPGDFNFVNVQAFNENGIGAAVFDAAGNLYVADPGNYRVQVFTPDRQFIRAWGTRGSAPGDLIAPTGIALDHAGNIYITEGGNERSQKFRLLTPYDR